MYANSFLGTPKFCQAYAFGYAFSTWSNDSTWQPALFISTHKIWVKVTPRLFGVIRDRSLTFNAQLQKLTTSLSSSLWIIRAAAHTSWDWRRLILKIAFHALIRSQLDYAAPTWQPWLSPTKLSCLDCLQNCSLWLITGQLVFTPLEALRLEADVQRYDTCSNRLILKTQEKEFRSADDHPKRVALAADIPQRLQNSRSFRHKANDLSTLLPAELEHLQTISDFTYPSWQLSTPHEEQISISVPGVTGRADNINLKHWCSLTLIASYQADYTICTNGSATGGTRNEGAAAVVTRVSQI